MFLNLFLSAVAMLTAVSLNVTEPAIAGKWTSKQLVDGVEVQYMIEINADGTYQIDLGQDGEVDVQGSYLVEDDKITFTENAGTLACVDQAGVYTVAVDEDKLAFQLVNDECARRKQEGAMTWHRM